MAPSWGMTGWPGGLNNAQCKGAPLAPSRAVLVRFDFVLLHVIFFQLVPPSRNQAELARSLSAVSSRPRPFTLDGKAYFG